MTILSDDLLEKAADAYAAEALRIGARSGENSVTAMRAALEAALPGIVEKCAQAVLRSQSAAIPADFNWSSGYDAAIETAVFAIRNLSTSTKGSADVG